MVLDSAKNSAVDNREACIEAAAGDDSKKAACLNELISLKGSIASTLGIEPDEIDDTDAQQFVIEGIRERTSNIITSCGSEKEKCVERVGTLIAAIMVRQKKAERRLDVSTFKVSDTEVREHINEGVVLNLVEQQEACLDTASSDAERNECSEASTVRKIMLGLKKFVVPSSDGENDFDISVENFKTEAAITMMGKTTRALSYTSSLDEATKIAAKLEDVKAISGIDLHANKFEAASIGFKAVLQHVAVVAEAGGTLSKLESAYEESSGTVLSNTTFERQRRMSRIKRMTAKAKLISHLKAGVMSNTKTPAKVEKYAEELVNSIRDSKHMNKDIEEAKQQVAGNRLLSCRRAGKANADCEKIVVEMLQTNLGSDASLEEVKARMQLNIFGDETECHNGDEDACRSAAEEKASQMGQSKSSVVARRRAAAINEAATVKSDCVNAVAATDIGYCDSVAKEAFEKLISFGYEAMKGEVDKLALAMGSGKTVPLKVHKAVDTLIQVEKKCAEASTEMKKLRDALGEASRAYGGVVATAVKESRSSDGASCGMVLVTRFPDEATITSSEVDTRAAAIHAELSETKRMRRLFSSLVIVSSAASVTQGDAELAEPPPQSPQSVTNFPLEIVGGICGGAIVLSLIVFLAKRTKNGNNSIKTKVVPFEASGSASVLPSPPSALPSADTVHILRNKHEDFIEHEQREQNNRHAALQARAAAHKKRHEEDVEKLASWGK